MASYNTWIMSIKAVFISTGVAAMALFLKVSVPLAVDFSVSRAPILWSSLLSWMKPPYLYVVINGIIITIAASSRFHQSRGHRDSEDDAIVSGDGKIQTQQIFHLAPPRKSVAIAVDAAVDFGYETVSLPPPHRAVGEEPSSSAEIAYDDDDYDDAEEDDQAEEVKAEVEAVAAEDVEEKEKSVVVVESRVLVGDRGDAFEVQRSTRNHLPERSDSSEITPAYVPPLEKPLVSARIGFRKSLKANPEGGRALGVAKPKRHETLENTWRMITEGKSMPLTRHLKKSDTFENHGRHSNVADTSASVFKKSETFRDRTNYQSPSPAFKLRKEPSLSQDELNRRVEAFIKKFNEEMRLQRLESLKQYQEMISRGI